MGNGSVTEADCGLRNQHRTGNLGAWPGTQKKKKKKKKKAKRQIVALSPLTPKRIWGCWSHYTDTSEPVINQNSHRTIIHTKNADGREMEN